jgi:hypothetical protein
VACYKVLNSKRSAGVTRCTGDETVGGLRCAPFARPLTGTFHERIYSPPFAPGACSCRKLLRIPVRAPVITCFPDLESRNFKGLLLISLHRARTRASSSKRGGQPNPRPAKSAAVRGNPNLGPAASIESVIVYAHCPKIALPIGINV